MIGDTVYIIEMNGCEWVGVAVGVAVGVITE